MPQARAGKHVLPLLFAGVLMGALDIAIVGPALPAIQRSFGLGERDVAWVFSIYVLFSLLSTPILAALSDSLGRRPIYLLAVALFTAGSLLTALSTDFWLLLLGRAIQGAGGGGIFPVASAVIWDTFPAQVRGRMLGMLGAVFGVAFLIGPVLGGVLLLLSWHWLFLVNIPIGLAVLIAGSRVLPASHTHTRSRGSFDWAGMLLLGGILITLVIGVTKIDTTKLYESLAEPDTWLPLVACLVLIPIFVRVEMGVSRPVVQVRLFSRRQVLLVALLAVGAGVAEAAIVFVPQLLRATFGVDVSAASFMLLPLVVAMGLTSPVAGRFVDRAGARPVLLVGSTLLTIGMLLTGLPTMTLPVYYVASVLTGMGLAALLGAPLRYIMLNEASVGNTASAQGALTLLISMGQLLGGVTIGVVAEYRGGGVAGYQIAFTLVGVSGLFLVGAALLLRSRSKEKRGVIRASSHMNGLAVDRLGYAIEDSTSPPRS